MALENNEREQLNAALKRHGYRWVKENGQWILKDPQGRTITPEKAMSMIQKNVAASATSVSAASAPTPAKSRPVRQAKASTPPQTATTSPAPAPAPALQKAPPVQLHLNDRPAIVSWAQQIIRRRPLIFDLETIQPGLNDEIIEVSLVDLAGRIIFHSLIKPDQAIEATNSDMHGIPTNMLLQAPILPEIWPQLYPLLIQNELIIFSAAYKIRILRQAAAFYQLGLSAIVSHCLMVKYAMYAGVKATERDYKLHTLPEACAALKIPTGSGRALEDAEATRQLLLTLTNA
ncbi:3'-5' exonuclease [Dictyobacter arantiisoli]|uniref:Exonuclease domain-containing protein n=1 Tax=Dictyobacter arantiisoli TaxID=2014874 RepID=A0A5A5TEU3_9CHLR|nr:3'-5' exonuclease [Dictyobacter arantiisoli]GCF09666.1 hypothetical protein KDI_32300 [Dictyobacter arantiisoli]